MTNIRTAGIAISLAWMILIHPHVGAATFSEWGAPVNLGCVVNSPSGDQGPALSKNGLSLYFGSNRPGGFGLTDVWVSRRASEDHAWEPAVNLGSVVNASSVDNIPALSRDDHLLFFQSSREGTAGPSAIWASYREKVHDDFGWQLPVYLGPGVDGPELELGPAFFANEDGAAPLLLFGRGPTPFDLDIYASELLPNGFFDDAVLIPELSSPSNDQRPSVRFDGLELFLGSNRSGSFGLADLWVSTRESVFDSWETPTNLGAGVNGTAADTQPYISADGLTLLFMSDRPGGCGGFDLYMTTRTRLQRRGN